MSRSCPQRMGLDCSQERILTLGVASGLGEPMAPLCWLPCQISPGRPPSVCVPPSRPARGRCPDRLVERVGHAAIARSLPPTGDGHHPFAIARAGPEPSPAAAEGDGRGPGSASFSRRCGHARLGDAGGVVQRDRKDRQSDLGASGQGGCAFPRVPPTPSVPVGSVSTATARAGATSTARSIWR